MAETTDSQLSQTLPVMKVVDPSLDPSVEPSTPAVAAPLADVSATEGAAAMTVVPPSTVWNCHKDLEIDGLPAESENDLSSAPLDETVPLDTMTVGRKFLLICQGEPVFLKKDKVNLVLSQKVAPHTLELLEVRRMDEKSADLLMTSYVPGQHKVTEAVITDGQVSVGLAEVPLTVQSVVRPSPDGQPPKPYGPFGPLMIAWPWYYWAILGGIGVMALLYFARSIWKRLRWKRLLEELAKYTTAMPPYNQFNKDLRDIHRRFDYLDEKKKPETPAQLDAIENAFRLYLVRELKVPALTWSDRDLLKVLRQKQNHLFELSGKDIRLTLRELQKAHKAGGDLTVVDCQQLAKLCQKTITKVWQAKKTEARSD